MVEFNGSVNLTNQSGNSSAFPDWASFDPRELLDGAGGLWGMIEGWVHNTLVAWGYEPFHVSFTLTVVLAVGIGMSYIFMQGSSKSSGFIIGSIKYLFIIAIVLIFLGVV